MKNILILGATGKIGQSIAQKMANFNFNLLLIGKSQKKLNDLESSLTEQAKSLRTFQLDTRLLNESESALKKELIEFGDIDIYINAMGIGSKFKKIENFSLGEIDDIIDINLKTQIKFTSMVIPFLNTSLSAMNNIITISSIAIKSAGANNLPYTFSKQIYDSYTECLRLELLGKNTKVTNIYSGTVNQGISQSRFNHDEIFNKLYKDIDLIKPSDIAETVKWIIERPPHLNIQDIHITPQEQVGPGHIVVRNDKK